MDINSLRERSEVGAFSVSELNNYIKQVFDADRRLSAITVKGEISNFKYHSSGHLYFSLKDADAQIKAVMFRSSAARLKFMPESGMKVIVRGSISVYARDGAYQIYVTSMQPDGIGALYLAYEQLKERLYLEGLFDENRKRPLPEIPERVGVITSPTGAAVQDIINVISRRFPLAKIYLYPVLVQGDGAEGQLVRAVDYFDKSGLADVVIIGRGGGSIEDLWAFNSEKLARRIFDATVPIISAVGHETDFTICDFVSDLRAPTPSAAAELAVPDMRELAMRLDAYLDRAVSTLHYSTERAREKLDRLAAVCTKETVMSIINDKVMQVQSRYTDAVKCVDDTISAARQLLEVRCGKLNALNPLSVLSRGYAVVYKDGEMIKDADSLQSGDMLAIRLAHGEVGAVVTDKK